MKSGETMTYFRTRMRQLRSEYTSKDRKAVIAAAGNECALCQRKKGDDFYFGPTNYLKRRILFKVYIDIHVIEGVSRGRQIVVMCNGCHMSYHLFNRLAEDAEMGKTLGQTVYNRCRACGELDVSCMCCVKCDKPAKWCRCPTGFKLANGAKGKAKR